MKRISGWGRRQVRRAQVIPGGGVRSHFPGSKMTRSPTDVRSSCIFTGRRNRCAHSVAFSPFPSLLPPPPSLSNSSLSPLISHLSADTMPGDREPWQVPPPTNFPLPRTLLQDSEERGGCLWGQGACVWVKGRGRNKEVVEDLAGGVFPVGLSASQGCCSVQPQV